MSKQQEGNFGSRTRKKRRRSNKASGVEDRVRDITEDSRENEISDKRDQSSRKRNDPFSKSRPRSREARKSRAERRKRKKKERKEHNRGGGRSSRQNDKRQDVERRSSRREETDTSSRRSIEKSSIVDRLTSLTEVVDGATTSSSLQRHSTLGATKRLTRTTPRRGVYMADTVEREFSKQLEMEISKSASKDLSILDGGIFDSPPSKKSTGRDVESMSEVDGKSMDVDVPSSSKIDFGNSRYDAERMLGYTRTKEDLPILDLENEVLERTLKDYNAYMRQPASLPHESPPPIPPRTSGPHPPRKPIINSDESDDEEETSTEVTGMMQDDTRGDLSCINGTFLPAPLSRHALIKYVK